MTLIVTHANCKTGFVYVWINRVNGKKYLGSHVGAENDGYIGSGSVFKRAIAKHGIDRFIRVVVESNIPDDLVRGREQFYLDLTNAAASRDFYNVRAKVDGGFEHINSSPLAEEYRRKAAKTYQKNKSSRPKREGWNKGIPMREDVKLKVSAANKRSLTEVKGVPVYCFDFGGNHIATFHSISEAAASVNGSPSNIKYTCEGRFKAAYDRLWAYTPQAPMVDRDRSNVRKRVVTPLGEFKTITAAAEAHGINPLTLKRRIWRGNPGYSW
jgi:group I intron endonuclease